MVEARAEFVLRTGFVSKGPGLRLVGRRRPGARCATGLLLPLRT